ncbi:MAG: hypothetical protein GY861_01795, partial [bacterium]|nr:hypothetical protein [bacterium]
MAPQDSSNEQDSHPLPKEKIPVIKNERPIRRTTKKRKLRTKAHMLSESSELSLKKAEDQKKTIRQKRNRLVQKQKERNTSAEIFKILVLIESGSNLGPDTLKPILYYLYTYEDRTVLLKGSCCAKCIRNRYYAGATASYICFQIDHLLQGNLHNTPCVVTVSWNRYFNKNIDVLETLLLKFFELSGWSAHFLSPFQLSKRMKIQQRMPQRTDK